MFFLLRLLVSLCVIIVSVRHEHARVILSNKFAASVLNSGTRVGEPSRGTTTLKRDTTRKNGLFRSDQKQNTTSEHGYYYFTKEKNKIIKKKKKNFH